MIIATGWQLWMGYAFLVVGCVHIGKFVSALRRRRLSRFQVASDLLSIAAFFIMGAAELTGLLALFIAGVALALASLAAALVQASSTARQQ